MSPKSTEQATHLEYFASRCVRVTDYNPILSRVYRPSQVFENCVRTFYATILEDVCVLNLNDWYILYVESRAFG
jgi:hypothetical protein